MQRGTQAFEHALLRKVIKCRVLQAKHFKILKDFLREHIDHIL